MDNPSSFPMIRPLFLFYFFTDQHINYFPHGLHIFLDLVNVGKKGSALEVLFEMLLYRRARSWQKSLEPPMFLFVDLCVEMKRNQQFKRIAHHYRNISIQECPQSLDDVLKHYFSLIKEKTVEARKQSEDAVPDVEDLDILETPERFCIRSS